MRVSKGKGLDFAPTKPRSAADVSATSRRFRQGDRGWNLDVVREIGVEGGWRLGMYAGAAPLKSPNRITPPTIRVGDFNCASRRGPPPLSATHSQLLLEAGVRFLKTKIFFIFAMRFD